MLNVLCSLELSKHSACNFVFTEVEIRRAKIMIRGPVGAFLATVGQFEPCYLF